MMNNETANEIIELLALEASYKSQSLTLLAEGDSRYLRDMKLNLKTALKSSLLSEKEIALLGVALSSNERNDTLLSYFVQNANTKEATKEEIADAVACASLLSSNNIFYRFRHFVDNEKYQKIPARLRMNIMRNPILGKEFFELVSLAISAVNGCEMCVKSHEKSLIALGTSEERIFDAIRLASVLTSVSKIMV